MLEVEVKIRADLAVIEPLLTKLGFAGGSSEYERDVYFNGNKTDLKADDKALRIRENRNPVTGETSFTMNYKGPKVDNATMTRAETEFEIPSFEAGETMLNGLGFFAAGEVEKVRVHYMKDGITCCLDTVTSLGQFLEIEIMAEKDEYETALLRIRKLMKRLGLDMNDTVRESYLCMLSKA